MTKKTKVKIDKRAKEKLTINCPPTKLKPERISVQGLDGIDSEIAKQSGNRVKDKKADTQKQKND